MRTMLLVSSSGDSQDRTLKGVNRRRRARAPCNRQVDCAGKEAKEKGSSRISFGSGSVKAGKGLKLLVSAKRLKAEPSCWTATGSQLVGSDQSNERNSTRGIFIQA